MGIFEGVVVLTECWLRVAAGCLLAAGCWLAVGWWGLAQRIELCTKFVNYDWELVNDQCSIINDQ